MSNILYVKGMNLSESDQEIEEDDNDIWDDRKLNDAYDKALRMANAEVAKRIAMATNTNEKNKEDAHTNINLSKSQSSKSCQKNDLKMVWKAGMHCRAVSECDGLEYEASKSCQKNDLKMVWKAGMHCRAVYERDGLEYEAFLLRIINDKECIVRFLGYNNSEIVPINSLKPSLGKIERTRQIEDALVEQTDNISEVSTSEKMEGSDRAMSVASSGTYSQVQTQKKKSGKKKKQKQKTMNGFNIPNLPMPMPDFSHISNIGLDMPIPPPPPLLRANDEDQAVSSMLLSWYMSGYYTGLYQGLRRAKEERKN